MEIEEELFKFCMKCKTVRTEEGKWLRRLGNYRLYRSYTKDKNRLDHGYCPTHAEEYERKIRKKYGLDEE